MDDASRNLPMAVVEKDIFQEFHRHTAENFPHAVALSKKIDTERRRLQIRMHTGLQTPDEQEALAKGLAVLQLHLPDERIPALLVPWISAHGTQSVFKILFGIGTRILQHDATSRVGKMCVATARKFQPHLEYLEKRSTARSIADPDTIESLSVLP